MMIAKIHVFFKLPNKILNFFKKKLKKCYLVPRAIKKYQNIIAPSVLTMVSKASKIFSAVYLVYRAEMSNFAI